MLGNSTDSNGVFKLILALGIDWTRESEDIIKNLTNFRKIKKLKVSLTLYYLLALLFPMWTLCSGKGSISKYPYIGLKATNFNEIMVIFFHCFHQKPQRNSHSSQLSQCIFFPQLLCLGMYCSACLWLGHVPRFMVVGMSYMEWIPHNSLH